MYENKLWVTDVHTQFAFIPPQQLPQKKETDSWTDVTFVINTVINISDNANYN